MSKKMSKKCLNKCPKNVPKNVSKNVPKNVQKMYTFRAPSKCVIAKMDVLTLREQEFKIDVGAKKSKHQNIEELSAWKITKGVAARSSVIGSSALDGALVPVSNICS